MREKESQARTLVFTESAAIASAARQNCLEELGVEQYEIVAALDLKTSQICRDITGGEERAARGDNGNTYYVSSDTTYHEWEREFVRYNQDIRPII